MRRNYANLCNKKSLPITKWLHKLVLIFGLSIAQQGFAEDINITIPNSITHDIYANNYYFEKLLQLALQKTEIPGDHTILNYYPFMMDRERQRAILRNGTGLDIIWSSTTQKRESELLAIKFNVFKGFNEHKILLIRREDEKKFSHIKSLDDLRQFKAGTGSHWQDTQILEYNKIPFVTLMDYGSMFKMLVAKRFDYIIRGSQEIWGEIYSHPELPLMAETSLLLHYKQPVYFFVNKNNFALADRVQRGLTIADADGSMDKLLSETAGYTLGYKAIHNSDRTLLELANPE